MATELNEKTVLACNPAGIGRVVPDKCVAVALNFVGTGKTVAEYQEHMKKWQDGHKSPHLCFPGGGPMALLRYLVDRNKKLVVLDKKPSAKERKATKALLDGKSVGAGRQKERDAAADAKAKADGKSRPKKVAKKAKEKAAPAAAPQPAE
jgi:hypothetical protein